MKRLKFLAPVQREKLQEKPDDLPYIGLEQVESATGCLANNVAPDEVDSSVSQFKPGDVLFGKLRPYLAKAFEPDFEGVCTSELVVLHPKGEMQSRYLLYQLLVRGHVEWLNSATYGTKMPRLSPNQINDTRLATPALDEQRAIAEFLHRETAKIDTLIAKKTRLIELLEEKRAALITHAVTRGLNPDAPLRDSGVEWLGKIPAHWEIRRLRYAIKGSLVNGLFKTQQYFGAGYPLINVYDAYRGDFVVDEKSLERVEASTAELKTYAVKSGDIFFVRSSLKQEGVGRSVCCLNPTESLVFECHLVRGRPDQRQIEPEFLINFLNSAFAIQSLISRANTVTMATLGQTKLLDLPVLLPPIDEQGEVVGHVHAATTKLNKMELRIRQAIDKLQEYRAALITAAVTGRIDVREQTKAAA